MHSRTTHEFRTYSFEALSEIIRLASTAQGSPGTEHHLEYLREYFENIAVTDEPHTIVIGWHYTDRDYLEDYAAYYVRCFEQKYKSICTRLHFFTGQITEDDFRASLRADAQAITTSELNDRYLGFIVVRPLPHACIGRTCLRTYDSNGRRHFPVKRQCDSHLLGHSLFVDSLPFQQQDAVAAACATSALWSALQGTAMLFQHSIYSPVEITRIAAHQIPGFGRTFPNRGLNPSQMGCAIRAVGLEPEVVGVSSKALLQATAYAYLKAKIPLVMNAALFDLSYDDGPRPFGGDWDIGHAVTITGYSLGIGQAEAYPETRTLLRSSCIEKLYVHDDQVGPFARMGLNGTELHVEYEDRIQNVRFTMTSSWRGLNSNAAIGTVVFAPEALIIPVYHKIRVDFDVILESIIKVDEQRFKNSSDPADRELEWEIFLTTQADFKSEMRTEQSVQEDYRWQLLNTSLPRFLWRAIAYCGEIRRYEVVFDATDVAESETLILEVLEYSP